MAGTFGVAFFNVVNFLLLFCVPLNFKEILFNLIIGFYLSGLVYEITERKNMFRWQIPYFENSKFLAYEWSYIPIIIFYLYMNISLLYSQGMDYYISPQYKVFLFVYIVILFVINTLFKLVNYADFAYKSYAVIFKLITLLMWFYIVFMYLVGQMDISLPLIIVTIIIIICFKSLKKVTIGRNLKLLFYPMTLFYLTYMILICTKYGDLIGQINILLYICGALAIVIKFFSSKSSVKF